jgi:hypothetical protein
MSYSITSACKESQQIKECEENLENINENGHEDLLVGYKLICEWIT